MHLLTQDITMKFSIKERKKNPLMKREEVTVSISHEGKPTPNRLSSIDEVAKLLGAAKDSIIIDRIITSGGSTLSEARVLAYKKKEDIPAWRMKKIEQRLAKAREKAKAETPAPPADDASPEEAPSEKPAEESNKEEGPPEEKPEA
jgi:ribosomal protein S24E